MYTSSWCAYVLALALFPYLSAAVPVPGSISAPTLSHRNATRPKKGSVVLPFKRNTIGAPTLKSSKRSGQPKKGGKLLASSSWFSTRLHFSDCWLIIGSGQEEYLASRRIVVG